MVTWLRLLLLLVIAVAMVSLVIAIAGQTGIVEKAVLLLVGIFLAFAASRVWRLGAESRT